jgi:hypothetical protein
MSPSPMKRTEEFLFAKSQDEVSLDKRVCAS